MAKVFVSFLLALCSLALLTACGQAGLVTTTTTQSPPSASPGPKAIAVISPEDVLEGLPVYPGATLTTPDNPFYGAPVVSFSQSACFGNLIPETRSAYAQYIVQALAVDILSWYPNELVAKGYRDFLHSFTPGAYGLALFSPSQPLFDVEVHVHAVPDAMPSTTVFELLVIYHVPLPKPSGEILPDDVDSITANYFSDGDETVKILTERQVIEQLVSMVNNLPIRPDCIRSCPTSGPRTIFSLVFHSPSEGEITVNDVYGCEELGIHIGDYPILQDRYLLFQEAVEQIIGVQSPYPSPLPSSNPATNSDDISSTSEVTVKPEAVVDIGQNFPSPNVSFKPVSASYTPAITKEQAISITGAIAKESFGVTNPETLPTAAILALFSGNAQDGRVQVESVPVWIVVIKHFPCLQGGPAGGAHIDPDSGQLNVAIDAQTGVIVHGVVSSKVME